MRSREQGSIFAETILAVALIAIAVLVAAALLNAHPRASARLAAQEEILKVVEATLESTRAGALPLTGGRVHPPPIPTRPDMVVSLEVKEMTPAGLYAVTATARCSVHGKRVERRLQTMVWRPR